MPTAANLELGVQVTYATGACRSSRCPLPHLRSRLTSSPRDYSMRYGLVSVGHGDPL